MNRKIVMTLLAAMGLSAGAFAQDIKPVADKVQSKMDKAQAAL